MGTLYIIYCDNCEREAPVLPVGRVPAGWCKLFFCDRGEKIMCSYQCLYEYSKRCLDEPPTTWTPMWPQEDPCPPLDHLPLDEMPEKYRQQLDEWQKRKEEQPCP